MFTSHNASINVHVTNKVRFHVLKVKLKIPMGLQVMDVPMLALHKCDRYTASSTGSLTLQGDVRTVFMLPIQISDVCGGRPVQPWTTPEFPPWHWSEHFMNAPPPQNSTTTCCVYYCHLALVRWISSHSSLRRVALFLGKAAKPFLFSYLRQGLSWHVCIRKYLCSRLISWGIPFLLTLFFLLENVWIILLN